MKSCRSGQCQKQEKSTHLNVQIIGLRDLSKFAHQSLRAGKGKTWCHYGLHSRILEIIKNSWEGNYGYREHTPKCLSYKMILCLHSWGQSPFPRLGRSAGSLGNGSWLRIKDSMFCSTTFSGGRSHPTPCCTTTWRLRRVTFMKRIERQNKKL